ncbi:hypothetical protein EG329_006384 [Mollisiaceae sp. DMI_Dod_QoI]|nr:hypothetical protein EG329_006384 [Helotiales sp. DMI_Dod_QoI]
MFYNGSIPINIGVRLSASARLFELFTMALSASIYQVQPSNNSCRTNGTSRGNSAKVHYGIRSLYGWIRLNRSKGITIPIGDVTVITPFTKQNSLWREAIAKEGLVVLSDRDILCGPSQQDLPDTEKRGIQILADLFKHFVVSGRFADGNLNFMNASADPSLYQTNAMT